MSTITSSVADVKWSLFDEPTFQALNGVGWALSDGRSVVGSTLAAMTGMTNLPDTRGAFIRMSAYGKTVTDQNFPIAATFVFGTGIFTTGSPPSGEFALTTGQLVFLTSAGTLPAGLFAATPYYVIPLSGSTGKLASSLANAVAGTPVTFTDNGSGVHTMHFDRFLGSFQADAFASHTHTTDAITATSTIVQSGVGTTVSGTPSAATINTAGGNETRPMNVAFNCYVRIN